MRVAKRKRYFVAKKTNRMSKREETEKEMLPPSEMG